MKSIVIGSRGSDLALWQAYHVKAKLEALGAEVIIKIIKTQGDQIQHLSFDKLEGKGFFTKELEEALLNQEVDLAVHSHKDLPTESPAGLVIAAVSEREDPSEYLLINKSAVDISRQFSLKENAILGTSSARRKAQFLSYRPDVELKDLRGNVPTRINKLRSGHYDAIMLAKAGVSRLQLDLSDLHVEELNPIDFVPAPAQGVLALQTRAGDTELHSFLQALNCKAVQESIAVERKVLNLLQGGCQLPLGAYCTKKDNTFHVWISMAKTWDAMPKRLSYQVKNVEGLAPQIVAKLESQHPKSVFITRDLKADDYLYRTLSAHEYKVEGSSCITTEAVHFGDLAVSDWIFFASGNAVEYFFSQNPSVAEETKFAVIGNGTENKLRTFNKAAHFVGSENSTQEIAKKFAALVKNQCVLFPIAEGSLMTVQKELDESTRVLNITCYKTKLKTKVLASEADLLLFTSPSNVKSYFVSNFLNKDQQAIAIGKATGDELRKAGIANPIIALSPNEQGLIECVFNL